MSTRFITDPNVIRGMIERIDEKGMQARFNVALGQPFATFVAKEIEIGLNSQQIADGMAGCLSIMLRYFVRITPNREDKIWLVSHVAERLADSLNAPDWLE